ncbi:MAG: contractile injection system tape measure protein, partial [Burkholderiaceae bacterium]|nr:contractile injection system tape measure protein [Burkholderiaceae bacterium]
PRAAGPPGRFVLGWWLGGGGGAAAPPPAVADAQLRAWLALLAQQQPDHLCRLLRAANRRRPLAQRLAQACDAALAQRLLAILAPASQAAWIDCLAALQVAQESAAPDGGMAALDATFWQAAFDFLLRQSGANMYAAYRHLGQALMDKYRLSAERLRALLVSGLRDGAASSGFLDALTQGSARESEPIAADDAQQLAHWLEFGILPDLASAQADLRRWLQLRDDRTLKNALQLCAPSPQLLRRLQAYGALRTRMLRLLCAERGVPAATLQALLKQLDPGPSVAAVERLLLAALLAHSDWTPGALLHSLLQALAPQLGVSRQALLRQLQQAVLAKRLPMSLRREAADMVASAALTAAAGSARVDGKGATSALTPLALALDYLREGALPRWSSAANLAALRRWLMQGGLLPTNDAALTGLRALAGQRVALRRLLQNLSPNQLVQLLAALAPDFSGFVASWLLLAEDLAQDRRLARATRRIVLARHRESALMLLLREDRPQSAAAILRALGESAAAACAIAPELYWEILRDAGTRRAQADARFLPLLQTMPGKHAAQTELVAPKPSAEASAQNQAALDSIAALRRYLRFGEGGRAEVEAALLQALQSQRRALLHLLRGAAGRELERARIVFGFSASGLQQCLRLLLAQNYAPAALCIAALQMAMAALAGARGSACWGDACVDELLRALAESDSEVALARFVGMAAQGFRQASGVAVAALRVRALLALEGMRSQTQPALLAAQRALTTLPTPAQPEQTAPRRQPEALPTEVPEGARLPVENAGLVLLAPYIERYFGALELLRGREFVGLRQRMHAAYLLQYLVAGKQDAPEPALLLNKILCGVGTALPLDEPEPLKASEEKLSEQLLLAVIGHWKKLSNTSIAGLRETFLMRAGYLTRRDDDWVLQVQPGPYDVLMQSLPWSIATIRLPWMERPLWVQWT